MKTFKEFISESVQKIKVFTGPLGQKTSKVSEITIYTDEIKQSKFNLKSHLKQYESEDYASSFSGRRGHLEDVFLTFLKNFISVFGQQRIHTIMS